WRIGSKRVSLGVGSSPASGATGVLTEPVRSARTPRLPGIREAVAWTMRRVSRARFRRAARGETRDQARQVGSMAASQAVLSGVALSLLLLLPGLSGDHASARTQSAAQSRDRRAPTPSTMIDQELRAAIERHDVPGVVAMAATKNRILYQGAFGMADVASARRMSTDVIFRIMSMTKVVTSVAAMQLVERGRLGLDDPVEKYLPSFARLWVFDSFESESCDYRLRR